jgi:hypothetical protein
LEAFVSLYEGERGILGFKEKIRKKSWYFIPISFFALLKVGVYFGGDYIFWKVGVLRMILL